MQSIFKFILLPNLIHVIPQCLMISQTNFSILNNPMLHKPEVLENHRITISFLFNRTPSCFFLFLQPCTNVCDHTSTQTSVSLSTSKIKTCPRLQVPSFSRCSAGSSWTQRPFKQIAYTIFQKGHHIREPSIRLQKCNKPTKTDFHRSMSL